MCHKSTGDESNQKPEGSNAVRSPDISHSHPPKQHQSNCEKWTQRKIFRSFEWIGTLLILFKSPCSFICKSCFALVCLGVFLFLFFFRGGGGTFVVVFIKRSDLCFTHYINLCCRSIVWQIWTHFQWHYILTFPHLIEPRQLCTEQQRQNLKTQKMHMEPRSSKIQNPNSVVYAGIIF